MTRPHFPKLTLLVIAALLSVLSMGNFALADPHQEVRLFVVEKSKNPQNILVVYTRVDSECDILPITDGEKHYLFDFYWLMDGSRPKPTHPLIKKAARRRFVAPGTPDESNWFTVRLADLKELNHDLPLDSVRIEIQRDAQGQCQSRVLLVLGPSHAGRTMSVDTIYSKAKTFLGIPVGIHYVELRGKDVANHERITARFNSDPGNAYSDTLDAAKSNDP